MIDKKPEPIALLLLSNLKEIEHRLLLLGVVDPNTASPRLITIHHKVIGPCPKVLGDLRVMG